ncbi:MAG TPA: hypothetical protein VF702_12430 [Allosphingosinicella sp.]
MHRAIRRIDWRRAALAAAPVAAIALAAIAVRTPIAAEHRTLAALLFVWIVADSLMLSYLARRAPEEVEAKAALAILAGAFGSAAIAMPAHIRSALLDLTPVAGAMAAVVAAHVTWGLARARARIARKGVPPRERAVDALSQLVPEKLARFAVAEAALLHLALFQWRAAPDVPAGQQGFSYHRHLVPIASVMLFLQVAEIAIVHLLLSLWFPSAALILFLIGDLMLVYMIGLVKSFRLRPVLAGATGLRVRTGILIDRFVPWSCVSAIRSDFSSERVKSRSTENAALLAWPNLLVELAAPIERRSLLGGTVRIEAIALRLDDRADFLRFAAPHIEAAR